MRTPEQHMKTLARRASHLRTLERPTSWDSAERASLDWALANLDAAGQQRTMDALRENLAVLRLKQVRTHQCFVEASAKIRHQRRELALLRKRLEGSDK